MRSVATLPGRRLAAWVVGLVLLAGCGQATPPAALPVRQPASSPPTLTVVAIVRHYAGLLATGTRLTTPASRQLVGHAPDADSTASGFRLVVPGCEVGVSLDARRRLTVAQLQPPHPPEDPNRMVKEPVLPPAHLVRLGELRRAFGAGHPGQFPQLQHYEFAYRPVPTGATLTVRAFLSAYVVTDSTWVRELQVFKTPAD